jgi:hypothetical protein
MIEFIGFPNKKERHELDIMLDEFIDFYGDFYITRNNLRLFIKENKDLLFECLKKGDKLVYSNKDGVVFVTGFSDKSKRKYVKVLATDVESADRLLKVTSWHFTCDLWAKIKKNNPIKKALIKNNYRFCGDRGKELLLCRKYIPTNSRNIVDKGEEDVRPN